MDEWWSVRETSCDEEGAITVPEGRHTIVLVRFLSPCHYQEHKRKKTRMLTVLHVSNLKNELCLAT